MSAQDQADRNKAGTLPKDPTAETKTVAAKVPRVLTVEDILNASAVRALAEKRKDAFCRTGHYKLDKITGGFRPGFTWLVGADTSWGKSSWLVALTDDNLRAGKRVLIVSSEDTEEVYGDRLMARRAEVSAIRYRDQELWPDERKRVERETQKRQPIPVYVDARRWAVEDLVPHVTKLIREERIDVVAFDYVQEFQSKRKHQDERVKFREIASQLRHCIKDSKISGIIFSQLTLDEDTKIPTRRNIRECRDMANGAEVILLGFEPAADIVDKKTQTKIVAAGTKTIYVDKVKNGPRGAKIAMQWHNDWACFQSVGDPEAERIAKAIGDPNDFLPDDFEDR